MNIWIIWAGASGMMCTATILEQISQKKLNYKIFLFDKNPKIWVKVAITGWWRCNVTTWIIKNKELITKYVRWWEFIRHSLERFWPKKVMRRFESRWLKLKIEQDMRVFPKSDHSQDVISVFENMFANQVEIHLWEEVDNIDIEAGDVDNTQKFVVSTNKWKYKMDKILISTGWKAYTETWSSWDAYARASNLWHNITKLAPSLSSFLCEGGFVQNLSWMSFQNAKIKLNYKEIIWPILFTHFGISWPLAFTLSSHIAYEEIDIGNPYKIKIQLDKDQNFDFREKTLIQSFNLNPKKQIKTILSDHFSKKFVENICKEYNIDGENICGSVSKSERQTISKLLWWELEIKLIWRRPGDEFVTAGGVSTSEVDGQTMESKMHRWLYFAGEVLDIDWLTWWFNLQACRSTWYIAGENICDENI